MEVIKSLRSKKQAALAKAEKQKRTEFVEAPVVAVRQVEENADLRQQELVLGPDRGRSTEEAPMDKHEYRLYESMKFCCVALVVYVTD